MTTKVPVVDPTDLGRGHIRNATAKKYEVDLSDYVDGSTVTYRNGKLSASGGGGSAPVDVCAVLRALVKRSAKTGDHVVVIGADNTCALVPYPLDKAPAEQTCKIKWKAVSNTSLTTKGQPITVTYTYENFYDNTVAFNFEFTRSSSLAYTVTSVTKTSGAGNVARLPGNDRGVKVTDLPANGRIEFNVVVVPTQAGEYTFGASGRTPISGGENGSQNACGTAVIFSSVDGG